MSSRNDDAERGTPAGGIAFVDAAAVEAIRYVDATDALQDALRGGLDPAASLARTIVPVAAGQMLLMPSESAEYAGVKVVGVAPDNPGRGLPRIQGTFLLLDGPTLRPLAAIDAAALTTLRTPAVSALAARFLAPPSPCRLVVFGAGPQAAGHVRALHAERDLAEVIVVARTRDRAHDLADRIRDELAVPARAGDRGDVPDADIVVCATTAREPLFPASAVRPGALVIAVGSHEPDAVELDPALLPRSQVVVEDPGTAGREAGEVVAAVARHRLDPDDLVALADVACGAAAPDFGRTRVFKSVGMGWEDLVVAARIVAGMPQPEGIDRRSARGADQ